MITVHEFLVRVRIDQQHLERWISAGWLIPRTGPQTGPEPSFSDVDLARAQLIRDLKADFGVNDEGVDVILHLLDQMHGLRQSMQALLEEVDRDRRPPTAEP
jgi:chaperone modulatory protein CbpM